MFFSFPLKKERLKGLEGIVHIWKKYFIIFGLYYFQILKQILRKTIYFYYSKVAMRESVFKVFAMRVFKFNAMHSGIPLFKRPQLGILNPLNYFCDSFFFVLLLVACLRCLNMLSS